MHTLTRAIDLTYNPRITGAGCISPGRLDFLDLAIRPLRLWITLCGSPAPDTGLLIDVAQIDPALHEELAQAPLPDSTPLALLQLAADACNKRFPDFPLQRIALDLADPLQLALIFPEDHPMIEITRTYTFAAGHRLNNPDWSDEQNQRAFGKCANPAGHGHNYTLQVTLRAKPDTGRGDSSLAVAALDQAVKSLILDRFDHKNLNVDSPEFASLNPTVENMAVVFFDLLDGRFAPAILHRIRVWESPKTFADYFGPHAGPLRHSEKT